MARASRSKTPEFDPSELEDLILTPAVGSGVGSHLLDHQSESTTVVTLKSGTVGESQLTSVVESIATPLYIKDSEKTTVVETDATTVADSESTTEVRSTTVAEPTTVDMSIPVPRTLWLTEAGEIVPAS